MVSIRLKKSVSLRSAGQRWWCRRIRSQKDGERKKKKGRRRWISSSFFYYCFLDFIIILAIFKRRFDSVCYLRYCPSWVAGPASISHCGGCSCAARSVFCLRENSWLQKDPLLFLLTARAVEACRASVFLPSNFLHVQFRTVNLTLEEKRGRENLPSFFLNSWRSEFDHLFKGTSSLTCLSYRRCRS